MRSDVTVACVLRTGGDFRPEHVERLRSDVARYLPGVRFLCLTDAPGVADSVPLAHDWPRWWSKMELFAPWLRGSILYLDLDVTVVGDLAPLAAVQGPALLRDFYRPGGLQSAVMVLPEECRAEIWRHWTRRPNDWMRVYRAGGDQAFLERFWLTSAARLQDEVDGIVSYKVHVRPRGIVPAGTRLIVHHGKPRPWEV